MSSILTNNGAMVALQTLKSINSDLSDTQAQISTGKSVGSAKDNSALWAISKVMESDVNGFNAISESLSLGQSTVSVGRQAAETVTDLLTEVKGMIVASQEENVDRTKIQADIEALTSQIGSVVNAAQFNGLNLLNGQDSVDILSSLDRSSDGSVSSRSISVDRQDLSTEAGSYDDTATSLVANATASAASVTNDAVEETLTYTGTIVAGEQFNVTVGDTNVSFVATTTALDDVAAGIAGALNAAGIEGVTASSAAGVVTLSSTTAFGETAISESNNSAAGTGTLSDTDLAGRAESITFSTAAVAEGDGYRVSIGGANYDYVAGSNETMEDVARGLKVAIDSAGLDDISTNVSIDEDTGAAVLSVDNDNAVAQTFTVTGNAGGEATGGLFALAGLDVSTDTGASAALDNIETLIQTSIDAAAQFGSDERRLEIQDDFIGQLTDSLKTGIGALVDADMEEASARLQALQVQQQLGVQSLSIANQSPQSILSLFR